MVLTRQTHQIASIWPADALVLAALLRCPRSRWKPLILAALSGKIAAYLLIGDDGLHAALQTGRHAVEVGLALALLGRRGHLRLSRRSGVFRLGSAAVASCAVSCLAFSLALLAIGQAQAFQALRLRFIAETLSLLVFVPLMLAIADGEISTLFGEKPAQTAVALAVLVAVSVWVFYQSSYPFLFIPTAALVIVAIRSAFAGAALGVLIVAVIAVAATSFGHGPITLVGGDLDVRIMVLQVYLATLTIISLNLGAAVAERRSLVARLTLARKGRRHKSLRERKLIDQARLAEQMSQVGYWTLNIRSGAVYWSPETYRIHGVTPDAFDVRLEDALAFYVEEDRPRIADQIARSVAEGRGWELDAVLVRRSDGARRYVRSMASCETDDQGRVVGFFGVFKDMTEERRILAIFNEHERQYRLLADHASDVIATYTPDGVLTYVSPSIGELLGWTAEEMTGRCIFDFILPEDRPQVVSAFASADDKTERLSIEYRAQTKDRQVRWLEGRPRIQRDPSGAIVEITDSIRDVTERHERETALAVAQRAAEDATAAKSQFLANMSHEIRTPLNGVLGFAEVLAGSGLNDVQAGYVERIRRAGKGLSAVIDDILDASKIDAGKMTVEIRPFDLRPVLTDVLELTRAGIGARLDFGAEVEAEDGAWIAGDEQRVRQVLLNLLGNAAKFTQTGSIRIVAKVRAPEIEIRIIDTGIGISAEDLAGLFHGFAQADGSVSRRFGGTGLGLSISRSLARLMGGDLRLESQPGAGTTAILTLPYRFAEAPDGAMGGRQTEDAGTGPARSLRVLVVDDIETNLELVSIMLSREGHEVVAVGSAHAAIEQLKAGDRCDLILMDVQMPVMDGLEATRTIRAMGGPFRTLPIIALTANVLTDQITACRAAGMDDHIGKPIKRRSLLDAMDRVVGLSGNAAQRSSPFSKKDPMADLVARYRDHMATFSDEFDRIRGLDAEPKARAMATLTHSIAGTAGSLGFKAVSDAAFSAEAATIRYLNGDAGWQDVEAQLQIVTVAVRDALDADDRAIA